MSASAIPSAPGTALAPAEDAAVHTGPAGASGSSLWSLDAATYVRHPLHAPERAWAETNCYADLWIEVLHAQKLDPLAALAFTISVDFEGDQWTFFKPPPGDLLLLYGIEIHELNLWRPLTLHIVEQLQRGRLVIPEVDSFYLPDTRGTDYRTQHTKTTIAIESLDLTEHRLGYFHNSGYFTLRGEDFAGLFHLDAPPPPTLLPPYVEFAKLDSVQRPDARELYARSLRTARAHFARRPRENPIARFAARFTEDLGWLVRQSMATYHLYAFSTLRQLGASCELSAVYLRWLAEHGPAESLLSASQAYEQISTDAKALILKTARAVHAKKLPDVAALLSQMSSAWDAATATMAAHLAE